MAFCFTDDTPGTDGDSIVEQRAAVAAAGTKGISEMKNAR